MFTTIKSKIFPALRSPSIGGGASLLKSSSSSQSDHDDNEARSASQASNSCNVERHWALAMAETICIAGCSCVFCRRRPQTTAQDLESGTPRQRNRERSEAESDRAFHRSVPPTSSIMQVLYPTSFTNTTPQIPAEVAPPAYHIHTSGPPRRGRPHARESTSPGDICRPGDILPDNIRRHNTINAHSNDDQSIPPTMPATPGRRIDPVEQLQDSGRCRGPLIGLGLEDMGYSADGCVAPPAYTRFDTSRGPRSPLAADVLGPYPHISVLAPQEQGAN
ncbi:hypothetical protein BJ138DRAFT_668625 [Hygrophoropsis aurantiaca]|uniref:Uncharacterized protein n=1 Tax=Hygrophoropsis aurantiaca TaxID=72124 RepID=A0ACB8AJQ3_9AGAM|nr:hypothetical protein BJ138DRAFT_668625 [Hygrophoropsis aurantiaca]